MSSASSDRTRRIPHSPDERQPRVRAHEANHAELVEPRLEPRVIELVLVQELVRAARAAMAEQHPTALEFDDRVVGPAPELVLRRLAERRRRQLEGLAADGLVVGGAVTATTAVFASGRLLLVIPGHEHVEPASNRRHDLLAVATTADRVPQESACLGAESGRVGLAGVERREVAVRSAHRRQSSHRPHRITVVPARRALAGVGARTDQQVCAHSFYARTKAQHR